MHLSEKMSNLIKCLVFMNFLKIITVEETDFDIVWGETMTELEGKNNACRHRECTLGDFVADAIVDTVIKGMWSINTTEMLKWSAIPIVLVHAGMFHDSIPPGEITQSVLLRALPRRHQFIMLKITGQTLTQALFHAIEQGPAGQWRASEFLQVNGLRIVYDLTRLGVRRLNSIMVRCTDCTYPVYVPVRIDALYNVICPRIIADGGLGYDMLREDSLSRLLLIGSDLDIVIEYLKKFRPAYAINQLRIVFNPIPRTAKELSTINLRGDSTKTYPYCIITTILSMITIMIF